MILSTFKNSMLSDFHVSNCLSLYSRNAWYCFDFLQKCCLGSETFFFPWTKICRTIEFATISTECKGLNGINTFIYRVIFERTKENRKYLPARGTVVMSLKSRHPPQTRRFTVASFETVFI